MRTRKLGPPRRRLGGWAADPRRVHTREELARELALLWERAGLTVRDVARAIDAPDSTVGVISADATCRAKPRGQFRSLLETCGEADAAAIEE
jgi:hypothetical protein